MTVFIHIGFSKTGTKSIQHVMSRNADFLRNEYSINFPGFASNHWAIALPFLNGDDYGALNRRVRRSLGTHEAFLATASNFLARFESEAKHHRTHIMSAEALATLSRESASRLEAFFAGLGLQSKIVAYVRHPAERISSQINEWVKTGLGGLNALAIEDRVTPALRVYVEAFGKENVIVRRFGAAYFVNGDLIDDFMTVIHGAPIDGLNATRRNESLSAPAVLLADQLNEIAPLYSNERGRTDYLADIAGPKFLAPRSFVEAAVAANRESLEYLGTEFAIRFDDVDLSIFPAAISREFSPETIRSIAAILNRQNLTIARLKAEADQRQKRRLKDKLKRLLRLARTAG